MLYRILLWQPIIICLSFARSRDDSLRLTRQATSYKTGLCGILGREKTASHEIISGHGFQGLEISLEITPIGVSAMPGSCLLLTPQKPRSPYRSSGSWPPALHRKSVCICAGSERGKCTRLPLVHVSLKQTQVHIKSATCGLVNTKTHFLACHVAKLSSIPGDTGVIHRRQRASVLP